MFSKYLIDYKDYLPEKDSAYLKDIAEFASQALPEIASLFENATTPVSWYKQLAKMGMVGSTLPKCIGGQEKSYLFYGLICQELEKIDSSLRTFVSVQSSLCMYCIHRYGSLKQQDYWLKAIASGEMMGCFGLTEPESGSDPAGMQTTATKVAGGWHLTGHKTWISLANLADFGLIWAKTTEGIACFLVELNQSNIAKKVIQQKGSLRAINTGELIFNNCFIADDAQLPGTQAGLKTALACLNQARFGIAFGAMGSAQACFEIALDYCKKRKQFNRPLASFQLIQKELVDCYNEITKAQCLHLELAKSMDNGTINPAMISLAKRNACHAALKIARKTRALMGANGIDFNYHVMRHLTNLETVATYEGTENVHTLIVGNFLTGENAFT